MGQVKDCVQIPKYIPQGTRQIQFALLWECDVLCHIEPRTPTHRTMGKDLFGDDVALTAYISHSLMLEEDSTIYD